MMLPSRGRTAAGTPVPPKQGVNRAEERRKSKAGDAECEKNSKMCKLFS
jgi:hypothetical protein